jgi:hypothetical protein
MGRLLTLAGLGATGLAAAALLRVEVVNTPDKPVPAAIVGTPTVTLDQPGPLPVDIGPRDHAPAEPFDARVRFSLGFGGFPEGSEVLFVVPAGKIAVIETASAWFQAPLGMFPRLSINESLIGVGSSSHFIALTGGETAAPFRPEEKRSVYAATETLRLYAPAGSTVRADVFLPLLIVGDPTAQVVGIVDVTGYYVDAGV